MNHKINTKKGFTLIEVLTVIAILAILGAIIFPTVGQFRTLAKKSSDSSDLRDIVQASLLFASQNGERLVGPEQTLETTGVETTGENDLVDVAAVLAFAADLYDPKVWVSANETDRLTGNGGLYTGNLADGNLTTSLQFSPDQFSYAYVVGLNTFDSATTPVVYTRQSGTGGQWGPGDPYSTEGGHVAFLGGNVNWYEDLANQLIDPNGGAVGTIDAAVGATETSTRAIREPVATGTGG
ncbi:type II secretion system protein [Pelagicoccus sp. NFK12]|uniref:Type II secretion system protein n=1 Tax=Pelagicoccus enzymogenes TaxID=2773457 RepID=A0A927F6G4_9BACT|nr:type II secretion system protein [Pelagicoccus enzymogenes]MBD5779259.1 type II secretion system protein [Pelagicoccus enzymogenes]